MLSQTQKQFRDIFLLEFTRQLIKHSVGEVKELENVLESQDKRLKSKIKQTIKTHDEFESLTPKSGAAPMRRILMKDFVSREKALFKPPVMPVKRVSPLVLRIPEPRLPPRLQYLKPLATNVQIDIGILNPLVKDPMVMIIQCNGPEENIIVSGRMGTKTTGIILTKEEIDEVIKKFSQTAKIPIEEGITRIVIGRLILLAVVSKVISSKFTIKKMSYFPVPTPIR